MRRHADLQIPILLCQDLHLSSAIGSVNDYSQDDRDSTGEKMLQAVRNLCCIPSDRREDRPGEPNTAAQDHQLADRYPDLEMQLHHPAPSRKMHDQLATDSSSRFEFHRVCDRLIPDSGQTEGHRQMVSPEYDECRKRIDATMTSAYDRSPTFRRLFNRAWEDSLQHPGQHWQLATGRAQADALNELPIGQAEMQRIIALQADTPHILGIATYTTAHGEENLDWDRACLLEVIRALSGLPSGDEDGHPRGGVVEYTNVVLKEMGCQRPACIRSSPVSSTSGSAQSVPGHRMREVRQRGGLRLDLGTPTPLVDPDEGNRTLTTTSLSMPPAVARALERVLSEASPAAVVEVHNHLRRTQRYIDEQLQPDTDLLKYDSSTFVDVVRVENARKPALNLTLCESMAEVAACLDADDAPCHQRIIFRDLNAGLHYSIADILIQPGMPPSVIFLESADLTASSSYALYKKFSEEINLSTSLSGKTMGVIDVNVQRSPADCLVFCVSFALKSYACADLFARWHVVQQKGLPVARSSLSHPMQEAKAELYGKLGLHLYPESILPVDFIKHTHSREVIGKRLDALQPTDISEREMLSRKVVASELRFSPGGSRDYLPSIEYKRRSLLARTFNIMSGATVAGAISRADEESPEAMAFSGQDALPVSENP